MTTIGKFVAVEGIDAAGKSTVIEGIKNQIKNCNEIINLCHPPKQFIQKCLVARAKGIDRDEQSIFENDLEEIKYVTELRISEQRDIINPEIRKSNFVLYHRYIYSLYTYYYSKGTLDMKQMFDITGDIILPHMTIFLRVSPMEIQKRVISRNDNSPKYQRDIERIKKTAEAYDYLSKIFDFQVLDNDTNSVDKTINDCVNLIEGIKPHNELITVKEKINQKQHTHDGLIFNKLILSRINENYLKIKGDKKDFYDKTL